MALGGKRRERDQEAQVAAWQTARERVQWFLTRAESFTGVVNNEDPTIPVQLRPGEHALLVLPTSVLVEPRHPAGHWTDGIAGYSFRVARGNHYQPGSAKGDDFSHGTDDPVALDTGTATVTDSRVVFVGARAGHEWEYENVLGFHHSEEPPWTAIAVSGGPKLSGLRYDPSHVEAFRFSLTLGLARFHGAVDSLIADLRQQLTEIDAERPGGVVPQWSPAEHAPVPAEAPRAAAVPTAAQPTLTQPVPGVAPPTPVAVQPTPVAVQPTPVAVEPVAVAPAPAPPTPVAVQPVPVAPAPTPAPVAPTPVAVEPVMVEPAPTPALVAPTPVAVEPTPVAVQPVPVAESAPVTAQPAPVQPKVVAPEPVSVEPATPSIAAEPVAVAAPSAPAPGAEPAASSPLPAPGWYHDPYGSAQARWWDGEQWTANTA